MKRKLVHFKIPLMNDGTRDSLAISPDVVRQFAYLAKNVLGPKYIVLCTPFELQAESGVDCVEIDDITERKLNNFIAKCKKEEMKRDAERKARREVWLKKRGDDDKSQ